MVTLIHLSDIHFSRRDDYSQFDLDQQIRRAILEDLVKRPTVATRYDGVLITGDIAFGGKLEDYKRAQDWLNELFSQTGTSPENTYVVPGNHDVDRDFVKPEFPLWDSHARIRREPNPNTWNDIVAKQLKEDPLHSLLAPLEQYNNFAQGYDCQTLPNQLAWTHFLNAPLSDGTRLRLHGLNSALISDGGDCSGNLLLSSFQTSHLEHTPGVVDLTMCHHPPEWLMDKSHVRDALRAFASITLFGHEHTTRVEGDRKQVRMFAGAVQPSRRDLGWLPTFHVLEVDVVNSDDKRSLVVRVHTREFSQYFRFDARRTEDDREVDEHRIPLPDAQAGGSIGTQIFSNFHGVTTPVSPQAMPSAEHVQGARRELLVHFFRLGTPLRFAAAAEAGLIRDGDDSLHPQAMWAEVFRRAENENVLALFWSAVARHSPALRSLQNPFEK